MHIPEQFNLKKQLLQPCVSAYYRLVDHIDEGIRSTVLKFADDTKFVARVGSEEDGGQVG